MRLCEVLYCAALPFDHYPEMNGQSMWSDGCGVKAGLQICNIRFKASLTAIHAAGHTSFEMKEQAYKLTWTLALLPALEFYDGSITAVSVAGN